MKVRQESEAVYARLEMDSAVLLVAGGKSFEINDFKSGSGGGILRWKSLKYKEIRLH